MAGFWQRAATASPDPLTPEILALREDVAWLYTTGRDSRGWLPEERERAAFMWTVERIGLEPRRLLFGRILARRAGRGRP